MFDTASCLSLSASHQHAAQLFPSSISSFSSSSFPDSSSSFSSFSDSAPPASASPSALQNDSSPMSWQMLLHRLVRRLYFPALSRKCLSGRRLRCMIYIASLGLFTWPIWGVAFKRYLEYKLGKLCLYYTRIYKAQNMPNRVILMRHAESEGNVSSQVYERKPDSDIVLTPKGRDQAYLSGSELFRLIGQESLKIYCSPYTRAKQTINGMLQGLEHARTGKGSGVGSKRKEEFLPLAAEQRLRTLQMIAARRTKLRCVADNVNLRSFSDAIHEELMRDDTSSEDSVQLFERQTTGDTTEEGDRGRSGAPARNSSFPPHVDKEETDDYAMRGTGNSLQKKGGAGRASYGLGKFRESQRGRTRHFRCVESASVPALWSLGHASYDMAKDKLHLQESLPSAVRHAFSPRCSEGGERTNRQSSFEGLLNTTITTTDSEGRSFPLNAQQQEQAKLEERASSLHFNTHNQQHTNSAWSERPAQSFGIPQGGGRGLCKEEKKLYDYFHSKYDIQEELRLREQETGFGKRLHELRREMPQRSYHGNLYYRFFGGESGADVYDRVSAFVEKLHRHFLTEQCAQNFVIVSHGATIKVMLMRLLHWTVEDFQLFDNIRNGEIVVLEKTADCRLRLVTPLRQRFPTPCRVPPSSSSPPRSPPPRLSAPLMHIVRRLSSEDSNRTFSAPLNLGGNDLGGG